VEDRRTPEFCRKPVLILGCGNVLFGDDGFGCAVIEYLQSRCEVPDNVCLLDAGTGARKLLFTLLLSAVRPARVLIIDAVDVGRAPGELVEIRPSELPVKKLDDFAMHEVPSSNLLDELRRSGMEVRILGCQTGPLPEQIRSGMCEPVEAAVPKAAEWILREY
jgi:coenzyme F420 hydrogenase subunit delta